MRFINPIPFVRDIGRSREFYEKRLGLKVLEDAGSFVLFETGFAIHDGTALEQTVWGKASETSEAYGRRNLLLYFEHDDVDAAFESIAPHVELIHPVERQAWGQRVFRFYDPDGHAVEVGEPQGLATIQSALEQAWSIETSSKWLPDNPARGQCSVTALVVQDMLGGEIVKTDVDGAWHFYNLIAGQRQDFSANQFLEPIAYADLLSNREEALSDTSYAQYQALRDRMSLKS